ncbi:MAG: hypothetical protein F4X95_02625 [Oligoflexia bacterium]|nr:hypothetical protein [Bdellovibrionales bacterium]MYE07630.1 hypothetical protein [Oligoflexia bacterium]
MRVFCRYLLVYSLLFLPLEVFSSVGSVDNKEAQKIAACDNASEGAGKAVAREINPSNVMANIGLGVADDDDQKQKINNPGDPSGVLK